MRAKKGQLTLQKMEAVVLVTKRSIRDINVNVDYASIKFTGKTLKYLGINFEYNMRMADVKKKKKQ